MSCGSCRYWRPYDKSKDAERMGLCEWAEAQPAFPAAYRAWMAKRHATREGDCWDCPAHAPIEKESKES